VVTLWTNWSGNVRVPDATVTVPENVDALADAVARARLEGGTLRIVGAGHSFVPFWQPGDRLVSLARLSGIVAEHGQRVSFGAGTGLAEVGPLLAERGLALANMGDIDRQSLAGAISTGTHGTGITLGSLSSQVSALELMRSDGERHRVEEREALAAARVSLGLLGIVTQVTLEAVPLYGLHERNRVQSTEACIDVLAELVGAHRHIEFWWVPREDHCIVKTLDPIAVPAEPRLDDVPFGTSGERWGACYRVFPSERAIRFNEMEYAVPAEHGIACFGALRQRILREFPKLPWPIEYRLVAGDDGWLSPTQGRTVATLSVHQGADRPWQPLFDCAEPVLREHGGRPHWGKLHRMTAASLAPLYPRLGAFAARCRAADPDGLFRNAWLEALLPD
jgi:FAD/FMN-containing dehydrogenase